MSAPGVARGAWRGCGAVLFGALIFAGTVHPQAVRPAPTGKPIAMVNPSFNADAGGQIEGWHPIEHASGKSYTFVADRQSPRSRPSSLRIHRHGHEAFGLFEQRVEAPPEWAMRTVRLSAALRSAGVAGVGGGLVLQARTANNVILAHDHMDGRRLRGDVKWGRYAVELKLPPTTRSLLVGIMLEEGGTLWADDVTLELLD